MSTPSKSERSHESRPVAPVSMHGVGEAHRTSEGRGSTRSAPHESPAARGPSASSKPALPSAWLKAEPHESGNPLLALTSHHESEDHHRDVSPLVHSVAAYAASDGAPPVVQGGTCPIDAARTHHEAAEKQHAQVWHSPDDVARNLARNGDLATWSKPQLNTLDRLAATSPAWESKVTSAVAKYASGVRDLDEIPTRPAMQRLLHDHLLDGLDQRCVLPTPEVEQARQHLDGLVDAKVGRTLDKRLQGAEGDDALSRSLGGWVGDVRKQQLKQPALADMLERSAETRADSAQKSGRFEDVRRADDGPVRQLGNLLSDGADATGGAMSAAADTIAPLGDKLPGGLGLFVNTRVTAGFLDAAGSTVSSVGHSGTYTGLGKMVYHGLDLNPITGIPSLALKSAFSGRSVRDVLGDDVGFAKNVGTGFVSGYGDSYRKYGAEGVVGHVSFDVLSLVASDGAGGAAKAAVVARLAEAGEAIRASSLGQRIATKAGVGAEALTAGEVGYVTAATRRGRQIFNDARMAREALPPGLESIVKMAGGRAEQQDRKQG